MEITQFKLLPKYDSLMNAEIVFSSQLNLKAILTTSGLTTTLISTINRNKVCLLSEGGART